MENKTMYAVMAMKFETSKNDPEEYFFERCCEGADCFPDRTLGMFETLEEARKFYDVTSSFGSRFVYCGMYRYEHLCKFIVEYDWDEDEEKLVSNPDFIDYDMPKWTPSEDDDDEEDGEEDDEE